MKKFLWSAIASILLTGYASCDTPPVSEYSAAEEECNKEGGSDRRDCAVMLQQEARDRYP